MSCNWPHPHDCAAMELARIERDLTPPTYTTRSLTADESTEFVRKLLLRLGTSAAVDSVLTVMSEMELGVFVVAPERQR